MKSNIHDRPSNVNSRVIGEPWFDYAKRRLKEKLFKKYYFNINGFYIRLTPEELKAIISLHKSEEEFMIRLKWIDDAFSEIFPIQDKLLNDEAQYNLAVGKNSPSVLTLAYKKQFKSIILQFESKLINFDKKIEELSNMIKNIIKLTGRDDTKLIKHLKFKYDNIYSSHSKMWNTFLKNLKQSYSLN